MSVQPIPAGYHTVTPYLVMADVAQTIEFMKGAFQAEEEHRSVLPNGRIMHAAVRIGNSMIMLGEAGNHCPPQPISLYLYVPDTDAMYRTAMAAGGTSVMEPVDQFYGDRNAGVKDAAGNTWWIATHIEDVSEEELQRRVAQQRPPQPS
jgi:PhnB protein